MHARKLMLTAICAGPLLGTLAGLSVYTTMSPAPEPTWRKVTPDVLFTHASERFVEAGPQDLSPTAGSLQFALRARRFAADADQPLYLPEYRAEPEVVAKPAAVAAPEDSLAAEPATSAVAAATEREVTPPAAAAEPTLVPAGPAPESEPLITL